MDVGVNVHVDVVGFSFWLALRHCRLVRVLVAVIGVSSGCGLGGDRTLPFRRIVKWLVL